MNTNYSRPKWWQLYLTFPLLIGLFLLDSRLKLSAHGHQMVQLGILVLVYGLIYLWLKANSFALSKTDQRNIRGSVTVTRIPPYPLPEANHNDYPMFQLLNSEIKGTLSDTFEMDYIDAEFLPVDETPLEMKKE
jgi:hypothetical protein